MAITPARTFDTSREDKFSSAEVVIIYLSYICVIILLPFSLIFCFTIAKTYERAVVLRLGKIFGSVPKGPGLIFYMPCIDTVRLVDIRTISFDVPPQEVLSRDSVTVSVDAVVYYKVIHPLKAVVRITDYKSSTKLLAAAMLRNVIGTRNMTEVLTEREAISQTLQLTLNEATEPWGVNVERVEIKDVRLPVQLQRAMAAEAAATREARAKIIVAEGEIKASQSLKEASAEFVDNPVALQLRYLQTLNTMTAEKKATIIFPFPMEFFRSFTSVTDNLISTGTNTSASGKAFGKDRSCRTGSAPSIRFHH